MLSSPDWPLARDAVEQVGDILRAGSLDEEGVADVGTRLVALANHPKWEVRNAVADALEHLRHETFHSAIAPLLQDDNSWVRGAAERSLARRTELPRAASFKERHRETLHRWLTDIETEFGARARQKAARVAERYADLLVREARQEIGSAMRGALAGSGPAAVVGAAPAGPRVRVAITGKTKAKRTELRVDGETVFVTTGSLVVLLHLVAGRLRGALVHRSEMGGTSEQGWRGISRLNDELEARMPKDVEVHENDGAGSYGLSTSIEIESVDCAGLGSHSDGRVRRLADEIARLQAASSAAGAGSGDRSRHS